MNINSLITLFVCFYTLSHGIILGICILYIDYVLKKVKNANGSIFYFRDHNYFF